MPAIWISEKLPTNSEKSSIIRLSVYSIRYILISLIAIYQRFISPFWPPSCRFYPTCSTYACQAFEKYGIFRGGLLALIRILKCHPLHPGGYDPLI